jgi:hypothetical protein
MAGGERDGRDEKDIRGGIEGGFGRMGFFPGVWGICGRVLAKRVKNA